MVFALCACGSSSGDSDTPAASTVSLNVGTGGESGTYYGYTGILGTVIGQKTDVKLTVVATGGSKDNLVSMQDGMYDLATVQSDVMTYAYNGTNSFADSGKIDGFRVLCALYPETVQIVTTDPSLKTVEDLRGKRVCVGDVGSGTYFNAIDVFAAYDMTIDDVSPCTSPSVTAPRASRTARSTPRSSAPALRPRPLPSSPLPRPCISSALTMRTWKSCSRAAPGTPSSFCPPVPTPGLTRTAPPSP